MLVIISRLEDGTIFDTFIEDVAKNERVNDPNRIYEPLLFLLGMNNTG